MMGLFGGKKKEKKPAENKQNVMLMIENLGNKVNDLEEKIKFLEIKKNNQNEEAKKKLKAGDKTGAKQALAKKKKIDEQIKQYDGAIMMMDEQKMMLENAESVRDVFKTVSSANEVLIKATEGLNVDDLDKIRNDLEVLAIFNKYRMLKLIKKKLTTFLRSMQLQITKSLMRN